ncbi:MAG: hypothetical protein JWM86_2190 [Thermoleophilia bacterium]|nr:hypothetical protein [Thermoleophilia bacterium]
MVEGPNNHGVRALVERLRGTPHDVQLELPLGLPSARRVEFIQKAKEFAHAMPAKLGAGLLFKVGVPMVAATTPAVLSLVSHDEDPGIVPSLLVGSALGGTWGALVGGLIPARSVDGIRASRLRSAGMGASKGIVMAPAVAIVSNLVADWLTKPIQEDLDRARERARAAAATDAPVPRGAAASGPTR